MGIFAQSVGGGGGLARVTDLQANGAQSPGNSVATDGVVELLFTSRGAGVTAGAGGAVSVTSKGSITTAGSAAHGIFAQSIGGGGGTMVGGQTLGIGVAHGAGGGSSGDGGKVTVVGQGTIQTGGVTARGIWAQSIGGGGGANSASLFSTPQQVEQLFPSGAGAGRSGNGGAIEVDLTGASIMTTGDYSEAIRLQSYGGGGAENMGCCEFGGNRVVQFGTFGGTGDGGDISAALTSTQLNTEGLGSTGIWAHSAGQTNGAVTVSLTNSQISTEGLVSTGIEARSDGQTNNGDVTVSLATSTIYSNGAYSTGIEASSAGQTGSGSIAISLTNSQLIAGGTGAKGIVANSAVQGNGGDISISFTKSDYTDYIGFPGPGNRYGATGIVAGSARQTVGDITISLDKLSTIDVGSFAILVEGASSGTINNAGLISGNGSAPDTPTPSDKGIAIFTPLGMPLTVNNSGVINGQITTFLTPPPGSPGSAAPAPSGSTLVNNLPTGVLVPGARYDLGAAGLLRNAGALHVGERGRADATTVVGNLVQTETGRLRFDLDSAAGKVDHLHVTGAAALAGGFEVAPKTLLPGSQEVLSADGGVTLDEGFAGVGTHLFAFDARAPRRPALASPPTADFTAEGSDTEDRRSRSPGYLQQVWDAGGDGFATGFAALASVDGGRRRRLRHALDSLSGQSVAAIGYARYLGSQAFAQSTYSCPRFEDASVVPHPGLLRLAAGAAAPGSTATPPATTRASTSTR